MKIGFVVPDNRDEFRDYSSSNPQFGPAPTALLQGFEQLTGCEIHVISCVHTSLPAPTKLAANIWYHPLVVPQWGWRPTAYAGCTRAVRQRLRELDVDVVHGQGSERYCAL